MFLTQEASFFDSMMRGYREWQRSGYQDKTSFAAMIGALGGLASIEQGNPYMVQETLDYASPVPDQVPCVVTNVLPE